MTTVTVLDTLHDPATGPGAVTVAGRVDGDRVFVAPDGLAATLGWALRPEGLCRDDVCVPVADRAGLTDGDQVDLAAVAAALDRPVRLDPEAGLVAVGAPNADRRRALTGLEAPTFTLPDLDGRPRSLEEWRGRKRMLFAFSSW